MADNAATEDEVRLVTARIAGITRAFRAKHGIGIPATLAGQAVELDAGYRVRPHLQYLSDRIGAAVEDVEAGRNRMLAVSLPPRGGKSTTLSLYAPIWILRRHPEWKIISASYDSRLSGGWARQARNLIEDRPELGVELAADGGAGGRWRTVEGGGVLSASVRSPMTGYGGNVLLVDDAVKDFVEAHSVLAMSTVWNWWLSVALTRLEPPYLVIAIGTRWSESDFIGRLLSDEYEGDPKAIEQISIPAVADSADDVIGRRVGDPLFSPLIDETREEALDRWSDVKRAVGSYTWEAMFQQHPSSPKGVIFDTAWWRFWSMDERRATEDGRVVYLDPSSLTSGQWLDSWDCNFGDSEASAAAAGSWVVGQRWVRSGANRYLVAQQRGRWNFTQTLNVMRRWAGPSDWASSPCGSLVHLRLVEKKANGAAIINVLREEFPGFKPVTPTESKEARARAVTPEIESGNVFLPHPSDPGMEWVHDFLSEVRDFPNGAADDQVDAGSQALNNLRSPGRGRVTVPGRGGVARVVSVAAAAASERRRVGR